MTIDEQILIIQNLINAFTMKLGIGINALRYNTVEDINGQKVLMVSVTNLTNPENFIARIPLQLYCSESLRMCLSSMPQTEFYEVIRQYFKDVLHEKTYFAVITGRPGHKDKFYVIHLPSDVDINTYNSRAHSGRIKAIGIKTLNGDITEFNSAAEAMFQMTEIYASYLMFTYGNNSMPDMSKASTKKVD